MRKAIAIFVSMIILSSVVATPAFAKISNVTSGSAKPVIQVSNTGDNANICVPAQQVVNTGNVVNEQEIGQLRRLGFDNEDIQDLFLSGNLGGDTDVSGSSISIDPAFDASCDQSIA